VTVEPGLQRPLHAPRSVVIHGHFYQPPREDPWLDEVPREPSAAPYHDWNQRIDQECYRPVTAARIPGPGGGIARMVNTLAWISFNFGPTLLEWMERHAPGSYRATLRADRESAARLGGHGNALAQPYHHAILPLASPRDRRTEIRWGIADFRRRFGRDPTGMWLPEAAVDRATLDALAAAGIAFTIVGSGQVDRVPEGGLPGLHRGDGGRTLAVFLYDGAISHDVAFGPLVRDAEEWARRMADPDGRALVSLATDGETFGHHHRFGDMALARVVENLRLRPEVKVENFASFLARNPPQEEVEVVSPSSWSCAHGVERWRSDCGCRMSHREETHQRWRAPLRDAVEWLARELHTLYEREGSSLFADPWGTRDAYGEVVAADHSAIRDFVADRVLGGVGGGRLIRARELLEMERGALRSFTSCGWFFDDLAGLEGIQVIRYAGRAIELAGPRMAGRLESGFLDRLERAESNDPREGTGAEIYRREVRTAPPAPLRVAAGSVGALVMGREMSGPGVAGFEVEELDSSGDEHEVVLLHKRTGRIEGFRVALLRPSSGTVRFQVTPPAAFNPVEVGLTDLPEPLRAPVAAALRRELLEGWIPPSDRALVAGGLVSLRVVAESRLVEGIQRLSEARDVPSAVRGILPLIELLELMELEIPYEVLATLFEELEELDAEARAAVRPLTRKLGFQV